MTIRTMPFDDIDANAVQRLVEIGASETETLDFKRSLSLEKDAEKIDLLQDIVAMANAIGGTIVYGVEEGEGDLKGTAVAAPGLELSPDDVQQTVNNLIRDGIDEPLHGVRHRAVQLETGRHAYVIRIPPSSLAPHHLVVKNARWRFYLRSGSSNNPMTARQVKQVAVRTETGADAAKRVVEERTEAVRATAQRVARLRPGVTVDRTSAVLHLIPLFPPSPPIDLSNEAVVERFERLPPFAQRYAGQKKWSLAGLATVDSAEDSYLNKWTMLLRGGGLELAEFHFLEPRMTGGESPQYYVNAFSLEDDVRQGLRHVQEHADSSWVAPPFLFSLRVLDVGGYELGARDDHGWRRGNLLLERDIIGEPELVADWGDSLSSAFRRSCDLIWQAWGHPRSPSFTGNDWTR